MGEVSMPLMNPYDQFEYEQNDRPFDKIQLKICIRCGDDDDDFNKFAYAVEIEDTDMNEMNHIQLNYR